MKKYKGYEIDANGNVFDRFGMRFKADINGIIHLPRESLSIERAKQIYAGLNQVVSLDPVKETLPKLVNLKNDTRADDTRELTHERTGKYNSRFIGWYVVNGDRYSSTRMAELATGIDHKTIHRRCKSGKNGYSFEPE